MEAVSANNTTCEDAYRIISSKFWSLLKHVEYLRLTDSIKISDSITRVKTAQKDTAIMKTYHEKIAKMLAAINKINKINPLDSAFHNFMKFDSVQFEFSGGTIKNIIATGIFNGSKVTMVNRYPVPFSALSDLERFSNYRLFDPIYHRYTVSVAQLVNYIPHLVNNSEDYSPGDTTATFHKDDPGKVLLKQNIKEILRATIYSDLMGTLNNNPNGLIQVEVARKFNLWSRYFKYIMPKPCCPVRNNRHIKATYVGWFNYYMPSISWTKIEQTNRFLNVLTSDSMVYANKYSTTLQKDSTLRNGQSTVRYLSAIDIMRYSYLNVKPTNFNILSVHIPVAKSSFYWDLGAAWYITAIKDTAAQKIDSFYYLNERNYNVNSTAFNSSVTWEFDPHPSINFTFSTNFLWFKMWDKRFSQAGDPDTYNNYLSARGNHGEFMISPDFRVNVYPVPQKIDGAIFFRFSYTALLPFKQDIFHANIGQNFIQAQLGLSVRLLK